jgi:hypothetical protein
METVNRYRSQLALQLQRLAVAGWYWLRNPKLTASLMAIIAVVLLLTLLVPQAPSSNLTAAAWVATLPSWIQPWGDLLFFLGFAHIFRSAWFWLPLALLALSSLVALADYGPPSRRRASEAASELEWQHPLARRFEQSIRLPPNPDACLEKLKQALQAQGFLIEEPTEEKQRTVIARQRPWAWWGVIIFYAGLIVLCLAFLASHYTLETEQFTLMPFETRQSELFDGDLALDQLDPGSGLGLIRYQQAEVEPVQALSWRLYQPAFFKNSVIVPTAIEPVITVEARDETGTLQNLIPVQVELEPATHLSLPLAEAETALYFHIHPAGLDFQVLPVAALTEQTYNIQVRRKNESAPSENRTLKLGETFTIDNLSITVVLNHALRLIARRDLGLPLYGLSLIALLAGIALLRLWPPCQVWLIPEVKGRGGQLYGVIEKFGPAKDAPQFLTQLLTVSETEEEPVMSTVTSGQ